MVTTMASDHVCVETASSGNSPLMNAYGQASCTCVAQYERTKQPKSRGQHLNGLEKLNLPLYCLMADDVIVFDESYSTFPCTA